MKKRPVVGVPCDIKMLGPHPFHAAGEKYLAAVDGGADCVPILLPVPPIGLTHEDAFALCDGFLFTGSHSNVHPSLYGGPAPRDGVMLDTQRDALTIPLMKEAVTRGVPVFTICRGFQEMNVVFGGTLHQHLQEVPSEPGYAPRFDHREDKEAPLEVQYGPAHDVDFTPDGWFARTVGALKIRVNSLHGQGVNVPGPGLVVEGRAPDGTVEAMRVKDAIGFAVGVQWHPEWLFRDNPVSMALFKAFGDAVRAHAASKQTN
ncbi:MAG: gamma-glutamyl-gamma-aminobutyrate hydrolase family protein [Parvibaculaceae bacterium]|nr:gamma-glutamyl-gamma-aminobutyrate hydrolase family protein [Parvibaculaceae bacterium]